MEAGLTDHVWDIEELLAGVPCQPCRWQPKPINSDTSGAFQNSIAFRLGLPQTQKSPKILLKAVMTVDEAREAVDLEAMS
jgi:hypothetical protein